MEEDKTMVIKRLVWFVKLLFRNYLGYFWADSPGWGLTYGTGVSIYIVMAGMFVPVSANLG